MNVAAEALSRFKIRKLVREFRFWVGPGSEPDKKKNQ